MSSVVVLPIVSPVLGASYGDLPITGQTTVTFDLSGLNVEASTFTAQAAGMAGALQKVLFPGITAEQIEFPVAQPVSIPSSAIKILKTALSVTEKDAFSCLSGVSSLRWLADGRVGNTLPYSDLLVFRQQAVALAKAFVGNALGMSTFEEVTQGRAGAPGYSACGDFWNFVPWRMGCKDANIINRDDPATGLRWEVGKNISKTYSGAKRVGALRTLAEGEPQPGDLVLIGQYPTELEHVFVLLEINGTEWTSADYGQKAAEYGYKPSSAIVKRTRSGSALVRNGNARQIVGWIDLEALPYVQSPDLTGVQQPWPGTTTPATVATTNVAVCDNARNRSTVQLGSKGPDVYAWQQILIRDASISLVTFFQPDQDFGQQTHNATVNWQRAKVIEPDGIVGALTWAASCTPANTQVIENVQQASDQAACEAMGGIWNGTQCSTLRTTEGSKMSSSNSDTTNLLIIGGIALTALALFFAEGGMKSNPQELQNKLRKRVRLY